MTVPFRLSKFEVAHWFDGKTHLLRRGVDFPEEMADEDIAKRLRNAAFYRNMRVTLIRAPAGLLLQAAKARGGDTVEGLSAQLFDALQRNDDLEEVLREVSRALEGQVRELTSRLNGLEVELLIQKEELSALKTRQS